MITLSTEQLEKIDLIDKLFGALSVDQLREFTESEQVVARLKGTEQNPAVIRNLIRDHSTMATDIMMLKSQLQALEGDVRIMVKLAMRPYDYNSQADASSLKSKYSIY